MNSSDDDIVMNSLANRILNYFVDWYYYFVYSPLADSKNLVTIKN